MVAAKRLPVVDKGKVKKKSRCSNGNRITRDWTGVFKE